MWLSGGVAKSGDLWLSGDVVAQSVDLLLSGDVEAQSGDLWLSRGVVAQSGDVWLGGNVVALFNGCGDTVEVWWPSQGICGSVGMW
jgi:hypothetical protein